jgi:hypothetical protein
MMRSMKDLSLKKNKKEEESKMVDCWHSYSLAATNPPKERSEDPKRHNQQETKPSLNP